MYGNPGGFHLILCVFFRRVLSTCCIEYSSLAEDPPSASKQSPSPCAVPLPRRPKTHGYVYSCANKDNRFFPGASSGERRFFMGLCCRHRGEDALKGRFFLRREGRLPRKNAKSAQKSLQRRKIYVIIKLTIKQRGVLVC